LFYPSSRNVANLLIVAPAVDAELSGFRDIVFLDTPSDYNVAALEGKNVYVNGEICGYKMLEGLDTARESLLEIYATLRREINRLSGGSAEELAACGEELGFDRKQFLFALEVFAELGLISFAEGKLTVYRGVKAELNDSALYRRVCLLQAE
jgi:ssDNA-specific exonuclease RecJ